MTAGHLTAFEHEQVAVSGVASVRALDGAEADALEAIGDLLPRFCERSSRGVRLSNFCGVVSLGSRVLEVLPKVDDRQDAEDCRGLLLSLLERVPNSPWFGSGPARQHLRTGPLVEAFVSAFLDEVSLIVKGGLLREYREEEDDLRVVRGRMVIERQFSALANRHDLLACRFDELTADNVWNRVIKAGLRAVRPYVHSVELGRRWVEHLVVFDEVADVTPLNLPLDRLPADRRAARYLPAIEWVRRILAFQSPMLRAGESATPGLLFDVNALWEAAVADQMMRTARAGLVVESQVAGTHLATITGSNRRTAFLRPDVCVRLGAKTVAILDAKWKRLEVDRNGYLVPGREDVYQMHAYSSAFECDHLVLVYPWHQGLAVSRETTLMLPVSNGRSPSLSIVCLEVGEDGLASRRGNAALERFQLGLRTQTGTRQ